VKLGGSWQRRSWAGLALVLSTVSIIGSVFTAVAVARRSHHGRIVVSCVNRETGAMFGSFTGPATAWRAST